MLACLLLGASLISNLLGVAIKVFDLLAGFANGFLPKRLKNLLGFA